MDADARQIERVKVEIALKQAALVEHQSELFKLQREMEGFARQYDQVVGKLEAQLDATRDEIEDLRRGQPADPVADFQAGFTSFEEYLAERNRPPGEWITAEPARQRAEPAAAGSLRSIYRRLARKYHPDTSTDPAERARLTVLMAQINAAYRAKNLEELRALDAGQAAAPEAEKPASTRGAAPVREPSTYRELVIQSRQLDDEIAWVKSQYKQLQSGQLMDLKIAVGLARSQGRDLLKEMAARVRVELDSARAELAELRRRR